MLIWDESKRRSNLAKHGFDFLRAKDVLDGQHVVLLARQVGEEQRLLAVGIIGGRYATITASFRSGVRAMDNEEDIRRYTAEELRAMQARGEDLTDWARIDAMTEEDIEAAIASDPDEAGLEWDWDNAVLVIPIQEAKKHISLRLDPKVLRFFKSQGPGYQTRINAVLRAYVDAQQAKKPRRVRQKKHE
jgi:uncharacterized protein (DUF4415 family)